MAFRWTRGDRPMPKRSAMRTGGGAEIGRRIRGRDGSARQMRRLLAQTPTFADQSVTFVIGELRLQHQGEIAILTKWTCIEKAF
jgi:hypothetical protein